MSKSNILSLSTTSDNVRTPEPMPETQTRRTIKADKAYIARLKRQIKAEEERVALARMKHELEERLRTLRLPDYCQR